MPQLRRITLKLCQVAFHIKNYLFFIIYLLEDEQELSLGMLDTSPTIIAKLAIHQDRAKSRTGERDQTHSYWYIPSAPRVNYSLLVMESAGMMKMATGEGSPLRQGARTGSRLTFGGYRGLWRRNSRSIFCFGSFRVRGVI